MRGRLCYNLANWRLIEGGLVYLLFFISVT